MSRHPVPFVPNPFRRGLIVGGLAGAGLATLGGSAAFSAPGATEPGKLVVIILRGAMDGLAAVAPLDDPAYRALRGRLALASPGEAGGALPLTGAPAGFALHPAFATLHGEWRAGRMEVLHASATPYRERSHFDGQDVLESGGSRVFAGGAGWVNRALGLLPAGPGREGVGIGRTIPLALRGPAKATSWAPPLAPETDPDTLNRLMDLYAGDALLGPLLARAIETDAIADGGAMTPGPASGNEPGGARRARGLYAPLTAAAARILTAPGGPAAAVIGLDGWDTHANQGAGEGLLAGRFAQLDAALAALKAGMGPSWDRAQVIVTTEFGRTARVNGTGGTDHGTGGVAFRLGGATRGARLAGDWPGLSRLHEDRDLLAVNDVRRLFATSIAAAWRLEEDQVWEGVFARA
jgi:uncharacterized protein (DUF1501 family)